MTSVTINLPDTIDIQALMGAFAAIGIKPYVKTDTAKKAEEEEYCTLEEFEADVFPDNTHDEVNGKILKSCRLDAKLTQSRLAELTGIGKENISAMEHGRRPVSKKAAKTFAKHLNVHYTVLL